MSVILGTKTNPIIWVLGPLELGRIRLEAVEESRASGVSKVSVVFRV